MTIEQALELITPHLGPGMTRGALESILMKIDGQGEHARNSVEVAQQVVPDLAIALRELATRPEITSYRFTAGRSRVKGDIIVWVMVRQIADALTLMLDTVGGYAPQNPPSSEPGAEKL